MIGLLEIAVLLITLILSIVIYFKWRHSYWARKNVPYIQPSIPWGTTVNPFRTTKNFSIRLKENYDEFKAKGNIYGGLYLMSQPAVLILEPGLIKKVLNIDFSHFHGHGIHVDEEKEPTSGNLFSLDGEKWRNMRMKLTPTFTSGKMKMMYHTLLVCGEPMVDHINSLTNTGEVLHIKEILACFTTDVIGSTAFGIDCNSFKDPNAEFRKNGRKVFEPTWRNNLNRIINLIIPKLRLQSSTRETIEFFAKSFKEIVTQRVKSTVKRNDFVQLMLDLKNKPEGGLTLDQMAAQAIVFFMAGFETSSTTMTFALHELAHNQDIQEKLRKEINETIIKHDGKLTYDGIMEMKYLQMVIDETLRKFPAAAQITRVCNKDYTIEETGAVIETGTPAFISILGLHRDPEYFPNPEKFDPERFSVSNKDQIKQYTYLPFGEGPRICIGLRFGLMQTKVGLCLLLKNFVFTPHESMKYDMGFHKASVVLSFKEDLLLRAKKISN